MPYPLFEREPMLYFLIVGESDSHGTPTKDTDADIIKPANVGWNGTPSSEAVVRRPHLLKLGMLMLLMVALVTGGVFLVQYLSKNPVHVSVGPEKRVAPESPEQSSKADPPASGDVPRSGESAESLAMKAEAERTLALFVIAKNELDAKGAGEWGGDRYASMVRVSEEADQLLMEEQYGAASDQYGLALEKARALADASTKILAQLIEEGRLALGKGQSNAARRRFSLALMMDPVNQAAQQGLAGAKTMEAFTRLMDSGGEHERGGNLAFALADYQEAVLLDPESKEAREAFNRVKGRIADDRFEQLMSSGFTAYHNGRYEQARAAFVKAGSFKPDSREVRDALDQVDQAIRLAEIGKLKAGAMAAEEAEDWEKALGNYVAALELDPTVQFAVRGKERSLEQIRIRKHMRFYLEKPKLLESEGHRKEVRQLLEDVASLEPKGAVATLQAEELRGLLQAAQTPVKVILDSDNFTEVALYRVDRLGQFETVTLELLPGTYTVVGTRKGYKDVRETLVVKAGQGTVRLTIMCREKI
jgi:tetratricopeptide (TPR) repeat protein